MPTAVPLAIQTYRTVEKGHGRIENGLQYVKDLRMGEDASQTQVGYAAAILAMIRNTAISVPRRAGYRAIGALTPL